MKYSFDIDVDRRNTGSFKWDWCQEIFGTEDILPMSIADMDIPVPPQVVETIKKRAEHPVLGYSVRTEGYFQSVISWMDRRFNWQIQKDWILSTPGIVPALSFAVYAFTQPGDKIMIQPPVYHPFFDAITCNGRILVENRLKEVTVSENPERVYYEIDFEDFENKVKDVKMFILCSPHNPVGRVWKKEELDQMGRLCKKHGVIIISDEIHSDLVYKPNHHIPFGSLTEFHDISITCMAPSKTFNVAGLAASIIMIPNESMRKKYSETMWNCGIFLGNIFGNVVLEACYNQCEDWLEELLLFLEDNKRFIANYIDNYIPKIKIAHSEATFLTWIDFRGLGFQTHEELEKFLIEKAKIGFDTGSKFGENGHGFMRLNYGCNRRVLEEAMRRLHSAINELS